MANSTVPEIDLAHYVVRTMTQIFLNYILSFVIVFGIIGNLFSIIIFIKRGSQDKVTSAYLGPLACIDLILLIINVHFWLVSFGTKINSYIGRKHHAESAWGCKALVTVHQFFTSISGWTIVLFTLERGLVIHYPFKMAGVLNGRLRRKILVTMMVLVFLPNVGTSLTLDTLDRNGMLFCNVEVGWPAYMTFLFYFVVAGVNMAIPCLILAGMNIWILVGVYFPDTKIEKHQKDESNNKEKRLLKNLIAVSTCYLIFVGPAAAFCAMALGWSLGVKYPVIAELANLSKSWLVLNSAVNPILYTLSLPFYRKFLSDLCKCSKKETSGK